MSGIGSTLATIWRLSMPYFRSEDRWGGRILLGAVIAIELAIVGINVLLNQWNNRFYNALQDHNWDIFVSELLFFCVLAASFVLLAVYQLYLNQWLQIRWRKWLTEHYLGRWLTQSNHYSMQLLGDAADNPDQRIAEDIKMFIELTLSIGIGLLSAVVTLASFTVILWGLSSAAPLMLFGVSLNIPGYLFWAALIYAVIGTFFTHVIGRPLVGLNFNQQRFEADFRFNLVRVRENSEQIALLNGERAENDRLLTRFGNVVANWYGLMSRQKKLIFFTASYNQASVVFPFIMTAPAYFSGALQLGGLMQIASAFGSVQESLSFFVTAYRQLAEWRAVVERLDGFDRSILGADIRTGSSAVNVTPHEQARHITIDDLALQLPTGAPLVTADNVVISSGDRVLLTGPSGSGKSTLFRAIAGKWPFGAGEVAVPKGAAIMLLPQRPYFPVAPLAAAISYPAEAGTHSRAEITDVLQAVGLPALATRLDEDAHWNRMLSLGEQQRLGIARALLQKPDILFLDEATASLDEPAEETVYRLLKERLPGTTIVSIGHRSTLRVFHGRWLRLARHGSHHRLEETSNAPAAE